MHAALLLALLTSLPCAQGERCYTYTMSVRRYLGAFCTQAAADPWAAKAGPDLLVHAGKRYVIFCGIAQYLNLVATGAG